MSSCSRTWTSIEENWIRKSRSPPKMRLPRLRGSSIWLKWSFTSASKTSRYWEKTTIVFGEKQSFYPASLFIFSALCLLASRGRKPVLKDPEWAAAEKPRGVGKGDGENDRRVQQNEDCRTADRLVYGPAEEGEGSCKVTSKNKEPFFFL